MSGEFGSYRYGNDGWSRVATSTVMLQEASERLAGELVYTPLPFLPVITEGSVSSQTTVSSDGHLVWQHTPSACDLVFYQGDDIVIPLYFNDPAIANDDMSLHEWHAQIRTLHSYRSTLIADFVTTSEFHTGLDETDEYTVVELLLPRSENIYAGRFRWELYSISDADLSRFPKPADVDPADWPPPDALRTWLYGCCTIVPRTSDTDFLPYSSTASGATVGIYNGDPVAAVVTNGGFVVGPNGRVP